MDILYQWTNRIHLFLVLGIRMRRTILFHFGLFSQDHYQVYEILESYITFLIRVRFDERALAPEIRYLPTEKQQLKILNFLYCFCLILQVLIRTY